MSRAAPLRGVLWDTMFASKLHPGRPELLDTARANRGTEDEPLLAAPVVSEVVFGLRRRAVVDLGNARPAVWWEGHVLAGSGRFRLVASGVEALIIAARMRALRPASPAPPRRTDGRKDPERRLSWTRDIELASIGATSGLPVATENLRDFTVIAALLAQVAPHLTLQLRDSVGTG